MADKQEDSIMTKFHELLQGTEGVVHQSSQPVDILKSINARLDKLDYSLQYGVSYIDAKFKEAIGAGVINDAAANNCNRTTAADLGKLPSPLRAEANGACDAVKDVIATRGK